MRGLSIVWDIPTAHNLLELLVSVAELYLAWGEWIMGVRGIDVYWLQSKPKCLQNTLFHWTSWLPTPLHLCTETWQIRVSLLFFNMHLAYFLCSQTASSPGKRMRLQEHVTPQTRTSPRQQSVSTPTSRPTCLICRGTDWSKNGEQYDEKVRRLDKISI